MTVDGPMSRLSEKKKRVGIDAHILCGKAQGSATFLKNILMQLARMELKFEVVLFCEDTNGVESQIGPSNFKYVKISKSNSISRLIVEYPRLLAAEKIDIAVFQYISPPTTNIPVILVVHDILPLTHPQFFKLSFRMPWGILLKWSLRNAKLIISVSATGQREFEKYFPRATKHKAICYNAGSFDAGPGESADTNGNLNAVNVPHFILCVGRIEPRKNVRLLVEAFQHASIQGVKLVIVGKQDMSYSWAPPCDESIVHYPYVSNEKLKELYDKASLFVYPSAAEGFGIPLLDALLAGAPTISSNRTCLPEIAGHLAQYFDPEASDAVATLSNLMRRHFSENAIPGPTEHEKGHLRARFNWTQSANNFAAALEVAASN